MSTFRHVLMMTFKDEATEDQITAMMEGLSTMPSSISVIIDYRFGRDLGIRDGNPDFALVADFASKDDWQTYQDHPDHQGVLGLVAAVAADKTSVQYSFD